MDPNLPWDELQQPWIAAALEALEADASLRRWLRPELEAFFAALIAAAQRGDLAPLERLLDRWIQSLPEPLIEGQAQGPSLSVFQMLLRLQQATDQTLDRLWAGPLWMTAQRRLLPVWQHLLALAAQQETQARFSRVNERWEEIQQETDRLNQVKATFISVAAHELRTPLTVVEGYVAMLQEPLERLGDPLLLDYLEGIRRGTTRMREIVDDLIDLSQLHAHALEITFQPLWLNRLLQGLAAEFAPVIQERQQTLEIRDFPGSDVLLYGDPARLRQAFANLLSNAVKFTPDGGRITVDGRLLPGFVEVTIADTGIGIAPEHQRYIFDFFARVGNPLTHSSGKTKFKGGGPGLGLPITKGIIEAHGGTIWVESPGHDEKRCPGSTFHVLLPLHESPPKAETPARETFRQLAEALRATEEISHESTTR